MAITTEQEKQWSRDLAQSINVTKKAELEEPEELEQRITSTSVMPRELNQEEVEAGQESGLARRLNMFKMQAKQMAQQAVEMVKKQVKRVVIRAIIQAITAIISFIIANWWIILIVVIVLFAALYVAYIVENPTEALTSLKSVGCAVGSIFGDNYDCWAEAIFK